MSEINKPDERGSVLILVLVIVMILSFLGFSSLTQSTTEFSAVQNFTLDKQGFFAAETGVQHGIDNMRKTMDPVALSFTGGSGNSSYRSGKLSDGSAQPIKGFTGFNPPPPTGMSFELGGEIGVILTAWDLWVSAYITGSGKAQTRKELRNVVVLLSPEY